MCCGKNISRTASTRCASSEPNNVYVMGETIRQSLFRGAFSQVCRSLGTIQQTGCTIWWESMYQMHGNVRLGAYGHVRATPEVSVNTTQEYSARLATCIANGSANQQHKPNNETLPFTVRPTPTLRTDNTGPLTKGLSPPNQNSLPNKTWKARTCRNDSASGHTHTVGIIIDKFRLEQYNFYKTVLCVHIFSALASQPPHCSPCARNPSMRQKAKAKAKTQWPAKAKLFEVAPRLDEQRS